MKRSLLLIVCLSVVTLFSTALEHQFNNESLKYRVMYKWGLINKQAGSAILSIKDTGSKYTTKLIARSEPWADKFYCVRDTLNGIIIKEGFKPLFYEKISHEGSEDKHDTVEFVYDGDHVTGHTTRKSIKKGKVTRDDAQTLEADGVTVDMLSSFYAMRRLPFHSWQPGHKEVMTIFSGKTKETLTFEYKGIERVEINGTHYQCFHITFIFTGKGGKKTSDNMDAWITTGNTRTPVLLEGKLPVGKVRCEIIK